VESSTRPAISVINLSLGGVVSPNGSDLAILENFVAEAQHSGLSVVAAAGNEEGPVLFPAAYAPILAAGAGDAGSGIGALCSFASRGDGLDLIAPGCDSQTGGLQGAFEDDGSPAIGSGSSQASAFISAVLASIRAYSPQLTFTQAEACLTSTARSGSIDVAAAFDACGLSQTVAEGEAAQRVASGNSSEGSSTGSRSTSGQTISLNPCSTVNCSSYSSTSSSVATSGFESTIRCSPPTIIRVANHGPHLVLRAHERHTGCRLQARLLVRLGPGTHWRLTHSVSSAQLVLPSGRFSRLQARYVGASGIPTASRWVIVNVKKASS
jgi:hypothetical protein